MPSMTATKIRVDELVCTLEPLQVREVRTMPESRGATMEANNK